MVNNRVSDKRILIGSIAIMATVFILSFGLWNEYSWYEFMAPLGTAISFVGLLIAFFCYIDIKTALRDPEFYIMLAGDIVTLINIMIIRSGIGSFFTVADLFLVLYLANKAYFPRKLLIGSGIYLGFFYYYWTFDVKGYFKGYNTNYGGLVLITGYAFAMLMLTILRQYLISRNNKLWSNIVLAFTVFMFAWGYNIISWYRARCALLGLIVIIGIILIPRKLWRIKWLYNLMAIGASFGAILISWIYILLGRIKDVFTIQIFYKDILSGRDAIWTELWTQFLKQPITGIGSKYVIQIDWMGGIFEVHNGLLDILIVHGVLVFALVMILLVKRLFELRTYVVESEISKIAMAGIMAILVSSFMENFFIVAPFTMCFMILFIFVREDN